MFRAVVLWERDPDPDWYREHVDDYAKKVPGATFRAGQIFGSATGQSDFPRYAEFEFSDRESFNAGVNSQEMGAAVEHANQTGIPFRVYFVEFA
jgi:hypothetical protein